MVSRRQLLVSGLPLVAAVAGCNQQGSTATTGQERDESDKPVTSSTVDESATPTAPADTPARVDPVDTTPEACSLRTTETVTPGPSEAVAQPDYPRYPDSVTEEGAAEYATAYERARRVQDTIQRYDTFAVQSVVVESLGVRTRSESGGVLVTFESRYRAELSSGERSSATVSDRLLVGYHVSERGVWRSQADPEAADERLDHPLVGGRELVCGPGN